MDDVCRNYLAIFVLRQEMTLSGFLNKSCFLFENLLRNSSLVWDNFVIFIYFIKNNNVKAWV